MTFHVVPRLSTDRLVAPFLGAFSVNVATLDLTGNRTIKRSLLSFRRRKLTLRSRGGMTPSQLDTLINDSTAANSVAGILLSEYAYRSAIHNEINIRIQRAERQQRNRQAKSQRGHLTICTEPR